MDKETERKLVSFVRTVAISGVDPNMCSDALDLLLEMQSGVKTIGQFRISPLDYMAIVDFMEQGHRIKAIKKVREITGAGLKDSKDAIDEWMADNPIEKKDEEENDDDIPF